MEACGDGKPFPEDWLFLVVAGAIRTVPCRAVPAGNLRGHAVG